MVKTFTAGRRLLIGDTWREPGEPVPEAIGWFRVDDWKHAGHIIEAEVSEAEFRAQLAKYKVADADAEHILDLVGLTAINEGPRGTPRRDRAPVELKGKGKAKA